MSHTLFVSELSNIGGCRDGTTYVLTGKAFFSFLKLTVKKAFSIYMFAWWRIKSSCELSWMAKLRLWMIYNFILFQLTCHKILSYFFFLLFCFIMCLYVEFSWKLILKIIILKHFHWTFVWSAYILFNIIVWQVSHLSLCVFFSLWSLNLFRT